MRRLLLGKRNHWQRYGTMYVVSQRGVVEVNRVLGMVLRFTAFLMQSGWKIGGTVVPPCDFHCSSTLIG